MINQDNNYDVTGAMQDKWNKQNGAKEIADGQPVSCFFGYLNLFKTV